MCLDITNCSHIQQTKIQRSFCHKSLYQPDQLQNHSKSGMERPDCISSAAQQRTQAFQPANHRCGLLKILSQHPKEQSYYSLCDVNEGYFPCRNPMFQWSKSPPVDRTCTQLLQDCHVGCSAVPLVLCKVVLWPSLMVLVHKLVSSHLYMQSRCRPL